MSECSECINKQAVVRGTTNPTPCCHLANDIDLLDLSAAMDKKCCHQANANKMSNSTGSDFDNKQIDLWPADPFTQIYPKCNQVFPIPRSVHTFPENFMQIGPAVFS